MTALRIGVDWPVMPVASKVVQTRQGPRIAALMPYPMREPQDAACRDDERFTADLPNGNSPDYVERIDAMRSTCGDCRLSVACAEWGIAHEQHLMFGGLTPADRVRIRQQRGQVVVEPSIVSDYGFRVAKRPALVEWGDDAEG